MFISDINVLVYARRPDSPHHDACRRFVEEMANGFEPFGLPHATESGFVRLVTDRRVFNFPTTMAEALGFIDVLRESPANRTVLPGPDHWRIFSELCLSANVHGNLVPDAYLAALAIEADAELVSCDRDFARCPGLRWMNPAK